jgi:RNA polymerase sigma-70 factor (ECF subfamily)
VIDRQELQRRLTRLAAGDRAELEPLYAALWPLVRRFTARVLASRGADADADAEDAAQEALVKLFQRAAEFDPRRDAVAFTLGIAAYECMTVRRRAQRRRAAPPPAADIVDDKPTPEESLITRELEAAALAILTTLRPEDREVLAEAARGGRAPMSATIRKRVSRALERLRQAWRARHGSE